MDLFPVVILAGGLATRMAPLTQEIPKSLLDINGEPFIFHQLRLLKNSGVSQVVLCLGHLGEKIVKKVGDGSRWGLRVAYSFDGPRLLGTAGAIRLALHLLPSHFFTLYGDSYLEIDYAAVQSQFITRQKLALMTIFRNEGKFDTSNVEYNQGEILAYSKTQLNPRMKHIDYGLGIFHQDAFSRIPPDTSFDLARLYQVLLAENQLVGFEAKRRFFEIGSFEGLEELRNYLSKKST